MLDIADDDADRRDKLRKSESQDPCTSQIIGSAIRARVSGTPSNAMRPE